ncbi:MAG: glycosyltransferase [Vulcanimicrobiota bacterium]
MSPLRLSVIICTRNAAHYLNDCLSSLQQQLDPPHEIIVVDGNSQDGSADVLAHFQEKLPGLRWFDQGETVGLAAARNRGMEAATGDLVAFLDVDARACPEWTQVCRARFEADPGLTGLGGRGIEVTVSDADRFRGRYYQQTWGSKPKSHVPFLYGLSSSYRRELALAAGGFDERFLGSGEDVDLGLRLNRLGHRLDFEPAMLVYHARRDDWGSLYKMADRWSYFGRQAGLLNGQPRRPLPFWVIWVIYATLRQFVRDMVTFQELPPGWWRRGYLYFVEARAAWRGQRDFRP